MHSNHLSFSQSYFFWQTVQMQKIFKLLSSVIKESSKSVYLLNGNLLMFGCFTFFLLLQLLKLLPGKQKVFVLSFRSQVFQQQRDGLQRDGQRDQVGPSVSAVELSVPAQSHLPGHPLRRAERRTLVLPQPREQTRGALVLHAGRGRPHGDLWHTRLW